MEKTDKYVMLYRQLESLLGGETDEIANMANTAASIHETLGFWWTGFYIVKDGPRAIPRAGGMHKDSVWQRCMRNSLGARRKHSCT